MKDGQREGEMREILTERKSKSEREREKERESRVERKRGVCIERKREMSHRERGRER